MRRVAALVALLCASAALLTPSQVVTGSRRATRETISIERVAAHSLAPSLQDESPVRRANRSAHRHAGFITLVSMAALCCAVTIRGSRNVRDRSLPAAIVRDRGPPRHLS